MIPKHCYFSPDIFEAEKKKIFESGYQFACLTSEVAKDRDFVCIDYAGTAVVLQNFKGVLRAFQNVCTHRFNRIQTEERGNRPLTCGYHGWSFDARGCPLGIAKRENFPGAAEVSDSLCLTSYRVETCGKFVFFAPAGHAGSLNEYLGGYFDQLLRLSDHIGSEVQFASVYHQANWKLLVENVVECYHCAMVHQETFIAQGFGRLALEGAEFSGNHSSCHFPRMENKRESLRKRLFSHLENRNHSHKSFHHTYIFPNLFIASTEGLSFYVGQALPQAADQTILRLRYFEPAVDLTPNQRIRQDRINEEASAIGLKLVEEDRQILENVQKGIRVSDKLGLVGREEIRVEAFMDAYLSIMGKPGANGNRLASGHQQEGSSAVSGNRRNLPSPAAASNETAIEE